MVYSVLSYLRLTSFKILNDVTFGIVFNCKKNLKKKKEKEKEKKKTISISSEMEKASCLLMISMLLLL